MSRLESLRGQVAFVTGAGSGIGRGVAGAELESLGVDLIVLDQALARIIHERRVLDPSQGLRGGKVRLSG